VVLEFIKIASRIVTQVAMVKKREKIDLPHLGFGAIHKRCGAGHHTKQSIENRADGQVLNFKNTCPKNLD
jgi:hypothetical protein